MGDTCARREWRRAGGREEGGGRSAGGDGKGEGAHDAGHKRRERAHNGHKAREHDGFPAIFFIEGLSLGEIFALEKPRVGLEGGRADLAAVGFRV